MFSGIVEEKAKVSGILRSADGFKLTVDSEIASSDARIGESISVNGVCLTVVNIDGKKISFDVCEETLRVTGLSSTAGKRVNLERSLKVGERISGHFVTGHIDCAGVIRSIEKRPNECVFEIEFPAEKSAYVADKGSIALDGVSLTIGKITDNRFKVYLIPLTLKETNLGSKKAGDPVNIEFDILGKYALKNLPAETKKSKVSMSFLREHGFA
ncbi:MAG: riboflavin synthase [Candidatus Omnitrophica bacterium]|nr:riboflavin synthase [Candidatus Omnitrophota bacterium]